MPRAFASTGIAALARATDGDRGEALLLAATEMFVSTGAHDRTEVHLYEELALNLLPDAAIARRQAVAALLAPHPDAPAMVLNALMADEIAVAAIVIDAAPGLSERDLLAVIATGRQAHAVAIAGRSPLPDPVILALAMAEAPAVRLALADNPRITLTEAARQPILEAAAADFDLARRLARRHEFGAEALPFAFLEHDGPSRLGLLAKAERELLGARAGEGRGRRAPTTGDPADIVAAVVRGDQPAAEALMAKRLGMPTAAVTRLMNDETGEALSVALRALGLDGVGVGRFLIFAAPAALRTYREISRLVGLAESATVEGAARALGATGVRATRHEPVVGEGRAARPGGRAAVERPAAKAADRSAAG